VISTLSSSRRADLILIDPRALQRYDSHANTIFEYREAVAAEQMLNRSDGVVTDVWIAGARARQDAAATPALGSSRMGSALTV